MLRRVEQPPARGRRVRPRLVAVALTCVAGVAALAPAGALASDRANTVGDPGAGADGSATPPPATPSPPKHKPPLPTAVTQVSDERTTTRWANPYNRAWIYARPTTKAKRLQRMNLLTEDDFPEVYLVLARMTDARGNEWVRIRVPSRPNGRTGWVKRDNLGPLRTVHTKLVIDRGKLRATLYNKGRRIFSARVGVGKESTPTPAGRFWIREKFRVNGVPVYGTRAIGTSAYAPTLSEWPGGGVVGLHGTNQPYLIPGRPSHGCIRLKNADIERLYKLAPVGTPIRIL